MDFSLCSPSLLFKFIDYLQEECKLGHGGRLGYIDAISELIDFRKVNGASDGVLRKLSATELYIKRARKTVAKMMRLQWTQDLDVETLEARGHWASMEELLEVVSFHLPRYEQIVKTCQNDPGQVNPSDLTFATKFLATYLFITNPTRYRQIIETQSLDALNDKEHRLLCEDQKHSSVVAKVHYQKRRSREVAVKAHECLQKLLGTNGSEGDMEVNTRFGSTSSIATFEPAIECARSENARPKIDTPHSNRLLSQGHQRRPLRFTTDEDDFLKRGIDKHGFGQWTAILRDPDFHFQKGRLADSLKKRPELRLKAKE